MNQAEVTTVTQGLGATVPTTVTVTIAALGQVKAYASIGLNNKATRVKQETFEQAALPVCVCIAVYP
jgi:hypothetical protein